MTLAACGQEAPKLNGMDLSGMPTGDFQLRDTEDRERRLADYRGQAVLLFFGFTQCPDVCPGAHARHRDQATAGRRRRQAARAVHHRGPGARHPEILKAYTQAFDPEFVGLRGDAEQTRAAAQSFKVFYQKVTTGSSYTMDHTALSYVIDAKGKLRLALRHQQSAEECAQDLRTVI